MQKVRSISKKIFFSISVLIVSPLLVLYRVIGMFHKPDVFFAGISQLLSLLPGKVGTYLRVAFYRFTLTSCRSDTVISFLVIFPQYDTEIESGVYIGPGCNIGSSKIGKNTLLGSNVHIISGKAQHRFDDINIPIKEQGGSFEKISIGDDCWVGNGALISANVGRKCIIGSGSVVVSEIPDFSIVAGNPAKVIKTREH